jgi:hypothetical protein
MSQGDRLSFVRLFVTWKPKASFFMIRNLFIFGLLLIFTDPVVSQSVLNPNYGLKSHETLVIKRIDAAPESTTIHLTVENRIAGGSFCADKNIYIIHPDGSRMKLISSEGIPVCPESHKFTSIGEKLDFTLKFPPLKPNTDWIDLIEDCRDNCFYFYGITLDSDLNGRLDGIFSLADKGESLKALEGFTELLLETDSRNIGIEGLLYVNIIKLAGESGNSEQAEEFYKKLRSSGAPGLRHYLQYLNDQGIKY